MTEQSESPGGSCSRFLHAFSRDNLYGALNAPIVSMPGPAFIADPRPGRPYVVVANRFAGRGQAHRLIDTVTHVLDAPPRAVIDADLTPAFKQRLNDAIVVASSHGADVTSDRPLLVCIGGDGTVSLAFDALATPQSVTLAVVPCGSGNDLALAIGISTTRQALELLRSGVERAIDYGIVNGRRFLNCVGMGLDAEVAAMAARIRRRGLAKGFSYYLAALRGLLMVRPVAATVKTADVELRLDDLVMLTVGNGPWYGGGFRGAPGASLDDGAFDCYAFRDVRGLGARLALMQRIRSGAHPSEPNVCALRTARLDASFGRVVAMHVDGELTHAAEARVELARLGARVIAPKRYSIDQS